MKPVGFLIGFLLVAVWADAQTAPSPKAIVGASLIDLDGGPTISDAVLVIEGDRIVAVGPSATTPVPPGAEIIRAHGYYLLPGLMNMHVHFGLVLPGRAGAELAGETDAALALRMAANARQSLLAGVTTVRLVGERDHVDFALKRAIERGETEGPRVFTAGQSLHVTGGHGARPDEETFDSPAGFRKGVRREVQAGASWIKIAISGGISDARGAIAAPHMTRDEMQAVTETAHAHGVKVTAHSGSPQATSEAVNAGVDCIEHGYYLTEAVVQTMKEKGTWYVPTLVVSQAGALEFFKRIGSPDWYLARAASVGKQHRASLELAIRNGVRIALGTDQFPYEPNEGTTATVREAELYVEAGMTPLQAIRAATIEPATMLGAAADLGSLEKGKLADVVGVQGDPSQDIKSLRKIGLVVKGGRVARNDVAAGSKAPTAVSR
jgi:imidazolonepropionase-like amidohydrolase